MRVHIRKCVGLALMLLASASIAGTGDGAGGGPSLTEQFENAWKASVRLLPDLNVNLPLESTCTRSQMAWVTKEKGQVAGSLAGRTLAWWEDPPHQVVQGVCARMTERQILLSERACKAKVHSRIDVFRFLLDPALKLTGYQSPPPEGTATCLAQILDSYYWEFAWTQGTVSDAAAEISRNADRLLDGDSRAIRYLRKMLRDARVRSAALLLNLDKIDVPLVISSDVLSWLGEGDRAERLARDILETPDKIGSVHPSQKSCAFTSFEPAAPVWYSLSQCKRLLASPRDAVQTVVHESTHHRPFSVRSELWADTIGRTVAQLLEHNPPSRYLSPEQLEKEDQEFDDLLNALEDRVNQFGKRRPLK